MSRHRQPREARRDSVYVREIQAFAASLTNVAAGTRRAYTRELELYVTWLLAQGVTSPRQVRAATVAAYARQLRSPGGEGAISAHGYAPSSIARKLGLVRAWHRFLACERDYRDPTAGVAIPRVGRPVPRVLTAAQVQTLLDSTGDEPLGQRDRVLLALLYYGGLSAAEACALRRDDWDPRRNQLSCGAASSRTVRVPDEARQVLTEFLTDGRRHLLSPGVARLRSSPLLPGNEGQSLPVAAIHRIVRLAVRQCGLPDWVTPRTLRASRAAHLLDSGADLRAVSALLGHANVGSTELHTRTSTQRLRETYDKAHPRA